MDDPQDEQLIEALRRVSAARTLWTIDEFAERNSNINSEGLLNAAKEIDDLYTLEQKLCSRVGRCSSLVFLLGIMIFVAAWEALQVGIVDGAYQLVRSWHFWVLWTAMAFVALVRSRYRKKLRATYARSFDLGEQWFAPHKAIYSPKERCVRIFPFDLDFPRRPGVRI